MHICCGVLPAFKPKENRFVSTDTTMIIQTASKVIAQNKVAAWKRKNSMLPGPATLVVHRFVLKGYRSRGPMPSSGFSEGCVLSGCRSLERERASRAYCKPS